jgi:hypothetical protein
MSKNNFFGPYHLTDFTENGEIKNNASNQYKVKNEQEDKIEIPNLKQAGIYIWGNLFDIDKNGKLLFPSDCTSQNFKFNPKKHQFVPYYVGKSESSMLKRLSQHKDVRNTSGKSDGDKYIRFSFEYWKEYFKDPLYERDSNSLINLVKIKKNSVIYHNDKAVLQEIYPQMNIILVGNNHPITAQILYGNPIYDTLDMVVNGANNFWFCFSPVDNSDIKTLGQLETLVYYSLKGKTTSQKNNYSKIDPNIKIVDNTNNSRIFKKLEYSNNTELIFPLNDFWGY